MVDFPGAVQESGVEYPLRRRHITPKFEGRALGSLLQHAGTTEDPTSAWGFPAGYDANPANVQDHGYTAHSFQFKW